MDRERAKLARKLRLLEELKWILMFASAVYVVILLISARKAPPLVARLFAKKFDLDWADQVGSSINDTDRQNNTSEEDNNSTVQIKKVGIIMVTTLTDSREEIGGGGGDHEEERKRPTEIDEDQIGSVEVRFDNLN